MRTVVELTATIRISASSKTCGQSLGGARPTQSFLPMKKYDANQLDGLSDFDWYCMHRYQDREIFLAESLQSMAGRLLAFIFS